MFSPLFADVYCIIESQGSDSEPLLDAALLADSVDFLVRHSVVGDIALVHKQNHRQGFSVCEEHLHSHLRFPLHRVGQSLFPRAVADNERRLGIAVVHLFLTRIWHCFTLEMV